MTIDEATRTLELFGIPGNGDDAVAVRDILATLLASSAISLGELQTARDIVELRKSTDAHAYLFLAAMFVSLRDGNTAFNPENKGNVDGKLLADACRRRESDEVADDVAALQFAVAAAWPNALHAADTLTGDVIKQDRGWWYFAKLRTAVQEVRDAISSRIQDSGETLSDEELDAVALYRGKGNEAFRLNDGQRFSVRATMENRLAVVTGGPGTGKTTIVCSILRALFRKPRLGLAPADVALAAPTGRAAQRMGEALCAQSESAVYADEADRRFCQEIAKLEGRTVHSLLGGYAPNWQYNADNPLPHRLVIVDECSMVSLRLMQALLSALRKDCRLVLLGDSHQLPSVDAGAVLGDLTTIGNGERAFAELTESKRFRGMLKDCAEEFNQGVGTTILSPAAKLPREGDSKWTDALEEKGTENGCFFYGLSRSANLSARQFHETVDDLLRDWAVSFGLGKGCGKGDTLVEKANAIRDGNKAFEGESTPESEALFDALDASRILTVVRKGPFGVDHVNNLLLKERLGRNPAQPLVDGGIPVLVTKNTDSMKLFNGDVGVTVKRGDDVCVLFPRGKKKVVCCPVSRLPEHELAYAITVHKSQGSEYGNVLVVLPDDATHPLLSRQLVYTGITRAKKRAVILGTEEALRHAIENRIERDTGIGDQPTRASAVRSAPEASRQERR